MFEIKKKILILLCVLGVISTTNSSLGAFVIFTLSERTEALNTLYIPAKLELKSIEAEMYQTKVSEIKHLETINDPNNQQIYHSNYLKHINSIEKKIPQLLIKQLSPEAAQLIINYQNSFDLWKKSGDQKISLAAQIPSASALTPQATAVISSDSGDTSFNEALYDLVQLQKHMLTINDETVNVDLDTAQMGQVALFIALICSLSVSIYSVRYAHHYLSNILSKLEVDRRYDNFSAELNEALEMADNEVEVYDATSRAMITINDSDPSELLVMGPDESAMQQVLKHPIAGAPNCCVASPYQCVAIRRGKTVEFKSSDDLNTCPRLIERRETPVSAVCVPITFMGRNMGVLHSISPVENPMSAISIAQMNILGAQIGTRIGTVRAFEKSQNEALTDNLTGLNNRRAMELFTDKNRKPYCLIMVDIDHFKLLNDCHGHEVGDKALVFFANLLKNHLESKEQCARWGGEEFAILLPSTDATEGAKKAERLRVALEREIATSEIPNYTASFGVAEYAAERNFTETLRMADSALYSAKEKGRNCVVIFEEFSNTKGV